MDRLRCIEVFVEVARGRSFSAAARRLGLSRANVTKQVAQLEKSFGAQLLTRTTKTVNLTEAGRSLLEGGQGFVQQFNRLEETVRQSVQAPKGSLHIGSPPTFGEIHLMPVISHFIAANPGIQVKLHLDYGNADLISEGLDLTLRVTPALRDTSLVAQKLTRVPQILVASPRYLDVRGAPRTPKDLSGHSCLVHLLKSPQCIWSFGGPAGEEFVQVSGAIRANFGEVLRQAALLGEGISMHPEYMVAQDLRDERLRIVLPEYTPCGLDVYVVYPSRVNVPARVRVFIDSLKDYFQSPAYAIAWSDDRA